MKLYINDETSRLKKVILGIGESFGGTPDLENTYDPKSRENIKKGTFPIENDIIYEMDAFAKVLEKYDVEVFRPTVIENYNQLNMSEV